jgi:chromate reductase
MRILAISGSLRRGSHNTSLLLAAEELLSPLDTFELWDGLREVPPYDQDDDVERAPPAVAAFRAAVASADAVLIATPEYNPRSRVLKERARLNTYTRQPFQNKPVAVVVPAPGIKRRLGQADNKSRDRVRRVVEVSRVRSREVRRRRRL